MAEDSAGPEGRSLSPLITPAPEPPSLPGWSGLLLLTPHKLLLSEAAKLGVGVGGPALSRLIYLLNSPLYFST